MEQKPLFIKDLNLNHLVLQNLQSSKAEEARNPGLTEPHTSKKAPPTHIRRKFLFTQEGILSETPSNTPPNKLTSENVHAEAGGKKTAAKKRGKTKLIKASDSVTLARPPPTSSSAAGTSSEAAEDNFKAPRPATTKRKKKKAAAPHSSRRSSADFLSVSRQNRDRNRRRRSPPVARNCIVATSMSAEDSQLLRQLVDSLGRFTLQQGGQVTAETSHVVSGSSRPPRRTVNLLRGLLRGCWLLSKDWLLASVELGRWADEEDFELTEFSDGVREARREREAFGSRAPTRLLSRLPSLYFSPRGCRAPPEDLREMAALAGGKASRAARGAGVVVGEKVERRRSREEEAEESDVKCVSEKWFFDTLQRQKVMELEEYLL